MTNAIDTKKVPAIDAKLRAAPDGTPGGIELTFGGRADLTITIDVDNLPEAVYRQAVVHGLKQKLVDAAAISRNTDTGASATIQDKYDAVREVAERLLAGEWNKRREAGAGSGPGGLLKAALVRLYAGRMNEEQLDAWLTAKTDKEKAALRKNPKVAEIIDTIRTERAKDTPAGAADDLLAELEQFGTATSEAE